MVALDTGTWGYVFFFFFNKFCLAEGAKKFILTTHIVIA